MTKDSLIIVRSPDLREANMDSDWLTARWVPTAKAFYVRALRKAAKMACHKPTRINKSTKHKGTKSSKLSHHGPMNLFASPDDGSTYVPM